jgi:CheY-like chemotaxis protein
MKTVLIADDERSLRELVETTLEDQDTRIVHAADGVEALERARGEHPDVLILDWKMPGKSGIEVVEMLHNDGATADIPIIMLTGMAAEQDIRRALALDITAYLVKPFSPLQLLECVQQVLDQPPAARSKVHERVA